MNFGTKVHEALELLDFKNPNYDLIDLDNYVVNKIKSFINSSFIKENINNKLYKEYEFTYIENDNYMHGIIDLMIEDKDKIIILDYKLKGIDDINYDKQLNGYRKVIENRTNKKIVCLLYSILDEKFREVKEV